MALRQIFGVMFGLASLHFNTEPDIVIPQGHENDCVSSLILNGHWNMRKIGTLFNREVQNLILSIPLSSFANTTDSLYWAGTSSGEFTVSSAY